MPFDLMTYLRRCDGRITRETVARVLGVSIATVMRRIRDGFTAEEVIEAAAALGLSPTATLVDLGALAPEDVSQVAGEHALLTISDTDLAQELLRRLEERGEPALTSRRAPRWRSNLTLVTPIDSDATGSFSPTREREDEDLPPSSEAIAAHEDSSVQAEFEAQEEQP